MTTYNRIKCNKGYLHQQHKYGKSLTLPMLEGCEWLITNVINKTEFVHLTLNGDTGEDIIIKYHVKTSIRGYQGMYDGVELDLTPKQITNFESIEDVIT